MKTVVAMSGGVDSSVVAYLLKDRDLIGVNLRTWEYEAPSCDTTKKSCCSPKDIKDARDIGVGLKIPFYVLKVEKEFKSTVIDNFIDEYKNGRTPNPCVRCNSFVKIPYLYNKISKIVDGDLRIATGHYARVINVNNFWTLARPKDLNKDQTYFLWNLSQDILSKLDLPLGDYLKSEVREIASLANLVTAKKPESQEICFIPNNDYVSFLSKHIDLTPGNFILNGKVIGKHSGKEGFTIGQRRGLGISYSVPLYVKKILVNGDIIVDESINSIKTIKISDRNNLAWNNQDEFLISTRYRMPSIRARLINDNEIEILDHLSFVSPGQSLVAYDSSNSYVLFGGIIDEFT